MTAATTPERRADEERLRWGRAALVLALIVSSLVLIAALLVLLFTGTDWGRERVRRVAQNSLNGMIHGKATIGRLSGNLLTGFAAGDVTITDSAGAPFVAVESIRGNYSIISLLRKHVWIDGAEIVRPLIVLNRPPVGPWNWQRIFPRDTSSKPTAKQSGWGDWVRFTNVTVVNAQFIVRTPWSPKDSLSPAVRDSIIRDALGGGSRLRIQRAAGGGFQKIVQLDSVSGKLPLVRIAEPGIKDRLVQVSTLSMNAYPFQPPGIAVRDMKGSFAINNDSLWWKGAYVALPQSKATAAGSYSIDDGDLTLAVHADPASLADMRWVYPRLPSGSAKLDLNVKWRGEVQDYYAYNADITTGDARAAGAAGITLGDTITLHDTDLRFSGVDTRLIEQLVPHFKSPRRGVLSGHAALNGGEHALAVNGDVTFNDQLAGTSRVTAIGEVGLIAQGGIQTRELRLQMLPVQVAMARTWMPSLPIAGIVTGSATVTGSSKGQLIVVAKLDHRDRGTRSVVAGKATVRLTGRKYIDADIQARPVSLVEIGRFVPAAGLDGSAAGPVHLTGTLNDLHVQADLRLPDGGRFATQGVVDVASKEKSYDLSSTLYTLNLRTVDTKAPITSLTAHATVRGTGIALPTMRATLAADLSTSRYDSIAVDTVSVRVSVADGIATVDKLYAYGAHTSANVSGSFGLTHDRSGELAYRVDVDSLGAFNRWLPKTKGDTVPVAPRSGVIARVTRRAREDSARIDRKTEIERAINGRAGPKLELKLPKAVPADTISGTAYAAGMARGNPYDFTVAGRAGGENVVARGNFVRRFKTQYAWNNARTPQAKLVVGLDADSVSAMGFAFDSLSARVTYSTTSDTGHVELALTQADNRQYAAIGSYSLNPDKKQLALGAMSFRFDTAYWAMPHSTLIEWGGPGIRVTDFELRDRQNGRVYASGLLPTSGIADFNLEVDNFPVSNIVDIAQTDVDMTGLVTLHGAMTGTFEAPSFRGTFSLADATYNKTVLPALRGRFGYAERQLVAHLDALGDRNQPMVVADGRIPIDLAITGVTGDRLLPQPITVDVVGDSLPLELVPQFTNLVTNVHGRAAAKVSVRGTLKQPSLVGALVLSQGTMKLTETGATFTNMSASIRMANDTVYVDSVAALARGPVHARGTIAVRDWRQPAFNLSLVSNSAELLNNDKGKILVDAGLALKGPFASASLSGSLTIVSGVVYAPETSGQHMIGAGDPELFNVIDTTVATERAMLPAPSPLLDNLRMEISLKVNHDTWVRNREANIEIYTDDPVSIHMEESALSLTGVITTDRGEYNILSKKFQIKRGSAMFIGTPDLNPTLQITGEYQVQTATRANVNISVLIGGTLKKLKLSLESDAQPPKTQSELLSLLAFGQSTTSLLSFNSSSVSGGGGAGSDLLGAGARLAATRLAGVAFGVLVDQLEVQAGRTFGTDVLDITPGDVPFFNGGNAFANFITQTKIEAGKYINGRTFVSAQEQAHNLGIGIEQRTLSGWRFNVSLEPRLLLREPTLNSQPYITIRTYGGFVIREWRF